MLVNCRKELANSLSIAESDLELSFGMSNDFEHAVSLLGKRKKKELVFKGINYLISLVIFVDI